MRLLLTYFYSPYRLLYTTHTHTHTSAGEGGGGGYGQARGGGVSGEVTQRLACIRQNVEALVSLEWQAQTSFFTLKRKWVSGGGAAGGDEAAAAAGGAGAGGGGGVAAMETA